MDNTGHGPLRVPGFGDMPLEEKLRCEQRFAHGFEEWQQMPAVTVRELAMVAVMNTLTDKPGWHIDIFNEDIATEWRKEAFAATPLMSEKAWAWCIAELRDKANEYTQKQYIRVLDTGSCVCKSDILVPTALSVEFKSEIEPLLPTQITRDQISSIVDPSLYPLVYGRSPVLLDGGEVVLEDVFGPGMIALSKVSEVGERLMITTEANVDQYHCGLLPTVSSGKTNSQSGVKLST
ncbi:hypothetical protein TrVFT333_010285 [Trichoderma virens FT-333]|nr:hypothetical protein TrVFT333_010285 [Trichoderma virens FT-333]